MLYTTSLLSLLLLAVQARPNTSTLVAGVQNTLKTMKDFSSDFEQISTDSSNQQYHSWGHLDLKRDGGRKMMRAEYIRPEAKLYVSDGKFVTTFIPAIEDAEREPIKESDSDFIPFMLLLGDQTLFDHFGEKALLARPSRVPGQSVLRLKPNNKKLPLIELEVDPATFMVHRLILMPATGDSRERTEFIFNNPKKNPGLSTSVFEFKPPPGVTVRNAK